MVTGNRAVVLPVALFPALYVTVARRWLKASPPQGSFGDPDAQIRSFGGPLETEQYRSKTMSQDFCLSCGALLPPNIYQCRNCGFDNAFDGSGEFGVSPLDDEFFIDLGDDYPPDDTAEP